MKVFMTAFWRGFFSFDPPRPKTDFVIRSGEAAPHLVGADIETLTVDAALTLDWQAVQQKLTREPVLKETDRVHQLRG
jgi:hypothetical protein